MSAKSKRYWYQCSLRTMFVLVFLVSIPLAWVGHSLNWIRQRQQAKEANVAKVFPLVGTKQAPAGLWLWGEKGEVTIWCDRDDDELVKQLFPEAEVVEWRPWRVNINRNDSNPHPGH